MDRIGEFLAMGGYAAFVWPSIGLSVAVLVGLLVASVRGLNAETAALRALEGAERERRR